MPKKHEPGPPTTPANTPAASDSSSFANARASGQTSLFRPQESSLSIPDLPYDILEMLACQLKNKELIALAQTNKATYQTFYPIIKAAMVKVLKDLVARDDTVRVKQLLDLNPNIQLREDKLDPENLAYKDIEITPYQDTLLDPFSEEMRALLEESFPEKTTEQKLRVAALEAEELKQKPQYSQLLNENNKIMEDTKFAYETYNRRYDAWAAAGYNDADMQSVRDAWMRVGLIQDQWSMRLRKIFSWVKMDESQTFEGLPRDFQNPCFYNDPNDPWLPGTIKGCDLRLMSVPAEQDLDAADFRANLRTTAEGSPVLICQGEGEEKAYHLYAPYIPLDRDESEWRVVPINDPAVIELIKWGGRPSSYSEGATAMDFSQQTFPYNSVFDDLYRFGNQHSLHLGSGSSDIFAAYNHSLGCLRRACEGWRPEGAGVWLAAVHNFAAVSALYKKRTERLATHLDDLERYLPEQKSAPSLAP